MHTIENVTGTPTLNEAELTFTFSRSGGAGGQNVNKVETKARLHWNVRENATLPAEVKERFLEQFGNRINKDGVITIASQKHRTQGLNRDSCVRKLMDMIQQVATSPLDRVPTKFSKAKNQDRLEKKRRDSSKKQGRRKPSMTD
ncbi:MAG: alternative ribosome rescue aminoacyl-tRNA hydrolase ArfB [Candidatus Melainabacteria bacterium]|nr:alternative ribosome rescue aminoacyl-tRNA hydrolase ArfB [Candidatus Melainabacteria bacterium]